MKKSIKLGLTDLQKALYPSKFKKLKASQIIQKEQKEQVKGGDDFIIIDKIGM